MVMAQVTIDSLLARWFSRPRDELDRLLLTLERSLGNGVALLLKLVCTRPLRVAHQAHDATLCVRVNVHARAQIPKMHFLFAESIGSRYSPIEVSDMRELSRALCVLLFALLGKRTMVIVVDDFQVRHVGPLDSKSCASRRELCGRARVCNHACAATTVDRRVLHPGTQRLAR
jgi:hypothetical protein